MGTNLDVLKAFGPQTLAQSAVPVMIAQSGITHGGSGTLFPGQGSGSVALSALTGSVTVTLSAALLTGTASDVGKQISFFDGGVAQWRTALITAQGSTTSCTATLVGTASGLGPFSALTVVGNPLPTNYTGGIWVYLPAGAVSGGAAGFYWCVATATATANGILQVTTAFQAAMGVPTIPTGFANAVGSGSNFTGVTIQQTAALVVVPGGGMGANGALRYACSYSVPANSNTKSLQAKLLGGFSSLLFQANSPTINYVDIASAYIRNRGSQSLQVGAQYFNNALVLGTNGTGGIQVGSLDTSVNQPFAFLNQTTVATDYIILEGFTLEVLYRP